MWVRKSFPYVPGFEVLGDDIRAKRWLTFRLNQLLDTGDPIWEIKGELKTIEAICRFVIEEFDYPLKNGVPTDEHRDNWFSGLFCYKITQDYWQLASETARTYRVGKKVGRKGMGDCEDTSVLFTTLMLERKYKAYECFGYVRDENWKILGGHGWAIFKDEDGIWRLFESTLDEAPPYPDGFPEIDPSINVWSVGNIYYEALLKFDRRNYYEWETDGEEVSKQATKIEDYLTLGKRVKETKKKYQGIEEAWRRKTTPLKKAGLLARIRWK